MSKEDAFLETVGRLYSAEIVTCEISHTILITHVALPGYSVVAPHFSWP